MLLVILIMLLIITNYDSDDDVGDDGDVVASDYGIYLQQEVVTAWLSQPLLFHLVLSKNQAIIL